MAPGNKKATSAATPASRKKKKKVTSTPAADTAAGGDHGKDSKVDDVMKKMQGLSIDFPGRIKSVPMEGKKQYDPFTTFWNSWQDDGQWYVDYTLVCKTIGDGEYDVQVQEDGMAFVVKCDIPLRFFVPGYMLESNYGTWDPLNQTGIDPKHPRYQSKKAFLQRLKDSHDNDMGHEAFKDIVTIPFPFKCHTLLKDPMHDKELGWYLNCIEIPGKDMKTDQEKIDHAQNAAQAHGNFNCCQQTAMASVDICDCHESDYILYVTAVASYSPQVVTKHQTTINKKVGVIGDL
jgi:hypothetical protein